MSDILENVLSVLQDSRFNLELTDDDYDTLSSELSEKRDELQPYTKFLTLYYGSESIKTFKPVHLNDVEAGISTESEEQGYGGYSLRIQNKLLEFLLYFFIVFVTLELALFFIAKFDFDSSFLKDVQQFQEIISETINLQVIVKVLGLIVRFLFGILCLDLLIKLFVINRIFHKIGKSTVAHVLTHLLTQQFTKKFVMVNLFIIVTRYIEGCIDESSPVQEISSTSLDIIINYLDLICLGLSMMGIFWVFISDNYFRVKNIIKSSSRN